MAAVSLFWDTNMAAVTARENTLTAFGVLCVQVSSGNCKTMPLRSSEKLAILTLKPRSHVRILIYRMPAIISDAGI